MSPLLRHAVAGLVALAGVVIIAALGFGWLGSDGESGTPDAAPVRRMENEPVRSGSYDWSTIPIGGGGFVTGLVTATDDGEAVLYARTDVGGGYRWDPASSSWEQILRTGRLDEGELEPADYSVLSIAVAASDPDRVIVLAGSDHEPGGGEEAPQTGRILRSDDGGRSWRSSEQRWFVNGNQSMRAGTERLAIDPTDPELVVVGTQRDGLWRSVDGGSEWERVPDQRLPDGVTDPGSGPQVGVTFAVFVPSPDGGSTLLVGVANRGLYASPDGGSTWSLVEELASGEVPTSPAVASDGVVLAVERPAAAAARLMRVDSVHADATVRSIVAPEGGSGRWEVTVSPHDTERLVLTDHAVRDGHLWTSNDGGEIWRTHDIEIDTRRLPWLGATDLDNYMSTGRLVFDPVDPDLLWFAEGMGVWRTRSLDESTVEWEAVSVGIEEVVVSSIVHPPGGHVYVVVADRQGFRFDDLEHHPARTLIDPRFASGTSLDFSAGSADTLAWVGAESNLDPASAQPRGAGSDDGGATWREFDRMDRAMYGGEVAVSATDPDVIVWLPTHATHPEAFRSDPLGVAVSDDGGRSWEVVRPDVETDAFHRFFWWFTRRALAADRVDGSFYLMSDEERFYRSTDGGRTWERAAHSPPCRADVDCHVVGQLTAVPGRAGHLWATTGRGGVFRTETAGASPWTQLDGVADARAIAIGPPLVGSDEPTVFVHARRSAHESLGVMRSTDGGRSWTTIAEHPWDLAAQITTLGADPDRPGRVYVGFAGAGAVFGDDPTLGATP